MSDVKTRLANALWQVYRRVERPEAWGGDAGNLPWHDPEFSQRMLREHLNEVDGGATRARCEREWQLDWMWKKLGLETGQAVFDVTCGPGLYMIPWVEKGCRATGIDFSPAAIGYARDLALVTGVADKCCFIEQDIREMSVTEIVKGNGGELFDAGIYLYGQLAVLPMAEAQQVLTKVGQLLKPGAKLCIELLNPEQVDKERGTWWFTDDKGIWGDSPFLHLGERFWDDKAQISIERFQIIHLETGQRDEIHLCDQVYTPERLQPLLEKAGFTHMEVYEDWDGGPLYDGDEWLVYIVTK